MIGPVLCVAAALLLRAFVLNLSYIRGRSMLPTLQDGEVTLVWRWRMQPRRGDVVICYYPGRMMKRLPFLRQPMVKRVIGLPGETLSMEEGVLRINGLEVRESYLDPLRCRYRRTIPETTLGEDEYYVMGDNRDASNDSRRVGPIGRKAVAGRVTAVIWPPRSWRRM